MLEIMGSRFGSRDPGTEDFKRSSAGVKKGNLEDPVYVRQSD